MSYQSQPLEGDTCKGHARGSRLERCGQALEWVEVGGGIGGRGVVRLTGNYNLNTLRAIESLFRRWREVVRGGARNK